MVKIAEIVEELVRQSPFLIESLNEGLINVSALARKLQPDVESALGRPIKAGAIVMAVNRMPAGKLTYEQHALQSFFRKLSDLNVRTDLIDYTFRNSDTLPTRQARLLQDIENKPNLFYSVSRGVTETTILVTSTLEAQVEEIFGDEKLQSKETALSAITLLLPTENRSLYGVYYYILKDLAWRGINLIELISTSNEFTIIVRNEDLDQAFSAVAGLRGA
jgi:hypothetical protein